jgi:hypothetical protein
MPFYTKQHHFTQTGSGQTQAKRTQKDMIMFFFTGQVARGKKTPFFAPFIYKMHYFTKTGSGQT